MKSQMLVLIFNLIAYIILFLRYQKRKRRFDLGSIILLIWVLGSAGCVWYYTFPSISSSYPNVSFIPFTYIFCINIIIFRPFCKEDYKLIKKIETYNLAPVLRAISVFFTLVNIPCFLCLLYDLFTFQMSGSALADVYGLDEDKAELLFPSTIKPFYSIIRQFTQFIIFLFFYNLTLHKRNPLLIFGLTLNIVVFFLFPILTASRGGVIAVLLSCIFYFFMLKNLFNPVILKKLQTISIISISLLVLGISAISVSRLGNFSNRITMDQWIAQYVGEGMIQFSDILWEKDTELNGVQTVPVLKAMIEPDIKNFEKSKSKYDAKLHAPIWVFYTYVGDFVIDYGKIKTVIIFILMSIFIKYLLKSNKGNISMFKIIILNYFFILITVGITADIYRTYYTQIEIFYVLFLLFILYTLSTLIKKRLQYI